MSPQYLGLLLYCDFTLSSFGGRGKGVHRGDYQAMVRKLLETDSGIVRQESYLPWI